MSKNAENQIFSNTATESKFDTRLLDKKVEHGFLTRKEREDFVKNLEAEADFDFTSAETLDSEDTPAQ